MESKVISPLEEEQFARVENLDVVLKLNDKLGSHQTMAVVAHSAHQARNGFQPGGRVGLNKDTGMGDSIEQLISRRLH